jgi:hypothetical protein
MNENCLIQKIASARGKLQPTVLKAVLNLYQRNQHQMSARDVKEECRRLDNSKDWNNRLPAICNAMRNAIKCDGQIISMDNDCLDFRISF